MSEDQEIITTLWRILEYNRVIQQTEKWERWGWAIILITILIVPALILGGIRP